jgi:hypothetical protein
MKPLQKAVAVFIIVLLTAAITTPGNNKSKYSTQTDLALMQIQYITANSASCEYVISGSGITSHGVCANENGSPTMNSKYRATRMLPSTSGTKKIYKASLKGLTPKTTYVVRAYIKKNDGTVMYSGEKSFTTLPAK